MMWKKSQKDYVRMLVLGYARDMQARGFNVRKIDDVKFSQSTKFYGQCVNHGNSCCDIKISMLAVVSGDAKLRNTIIHELCHASAPLWSHHDGTWQVLARRASEIYGTNIRKSTPLNAEAKKYCKAKAKYVIRCDCGREWVFQRKNKVIEAVERGNKIYCPYCKNQLKIR